MISNSNYSDMRVLRQQLRPRALRLHFNDMHLHTSTSAAPAIQPQQHFGDSSNSDSAQRLSNSDHRASASSAKHLRVNINTSAAASTIQQHLNDCASGLLCSDIQQSVASARHAVAIQQQRALQQQ
jgi:hypothetical protein